MAASIPFRMTVEAAGWLRSSLAHRHEGMEPALITQLGFETRTRGGKVIESYTGEHFGIGYYDIGRRPHAQHIELFGHDVSIIPDTLERLRGRTLTVKREVVGRGLLRCRRRKLLVAV